MSEKETHDLTRQPKGVLLRMLKGLAETAPAALEAELRRLDGYREDEEQERIARAQACVDRARDRLIARLRARAQAAGRA